MTEAIISHDDDEPVVIDHNNRFYSKEMEGNLSARISHGEEYTDSVTYVLSIFGKVFEEYTINVGNELFRPYSFGKRSGTIDIKHKRISAKELIEIERKDGETLFNRERDEGN